MADTVNKENDMAVQKLCDEFQQKLEKQIRRETSWVTVEIGHTISEKDDGLFVKIYAKTMHDVPGFFKTVKFANGRKVIPGKLDLVDTSRFECEAPYQPGEWKVVITCRKEEFTYVHSVQAEEAHETHELQLPAPKKPQRRMFEMFPRMKDSTAHGLLVNEAKEEWRSPICVVECAKEARPGYNSMPAHEYEDDPRTLLLKVKELARLFRTCKSSCAYTGAGLSTSSGINDYATKAGTKSKMHEGRAKPKRNGKEASPALGHRVLVELWRNGFLSNWVQQNHDGLPQKAGFPQHRINEIHGAWFDPSNPVVPMKGTLRGDLCSWLGEIKRSTDLAIAIGTSMCGMTADGVFTKACARYAKGEGLGGVIIGLQQTQYDSVSSLRIFARIDVVCSLLAKELKLDIPVLRPFKPVIPESAMVKQHVFKVPYDSEGNLTTDPDEMICWDLTPGRRFHVTDGPGKGFKGRVFCQTVQGHYQMKIPRQYQGAEDFGKTERSYFMGSWWIQTAVEGNWPKLPVVNVDATLQKNL